MIRFRDLLKDTPLWKRAELIIEDSQENFLRSLGKNDFYHSQNIEKILDRLIPDHIKKNESYFDIGDIFLLLIAIYLHDIGRSTKNNQHEIESYKMIKEFPALFHLNEHEAEAIAQICASHAQEDIWPITKNDENFGILNLTQNGKTFNLQVLGALLRLSDELDNSFVRTRGIPDQKESIRNIIRDINPVFERAIIEIHANPKTWQEYHELVLIKNYTQKRLREVQAILEKIELQYYQIWLPIDKFTAPLNFDISSTDIQGFTDDLISILGAEFSDIDINSKIKDIELPIVIESECFGKKIIIGVIPTIALNKNNSHEFIGVLDYLLQERNLNDGWVISYGEIPKECAKLFKEARIKLFGYEELIGSITKFKSLIRKQISDYKHTEIFKKNLFIIPDGKNESNEKIEDIEKYIRNWVNDTVGVQLTLLGDYGVGKTTIIDKVAYDLLKDVLKDSNNKRIPINIKLKELSNFNSIEEFITSLLVNKFKIKIDYKTFQVLNKEGKFVFFLDGFDEIPNLINEDDVLKAFRELDKLVELKSKVILSCRTHFFKNDDQLVKAHEETKLYNQVHKKYGYQILFLNDFERIKVEDYIRKWDQEDYSKYIEIIDTVYNLEDLSHRPVLLNLLVKTIPQIEVKENNFINSSTLYKIYINFWLKRDDWRTTMTSEDRLLLSQLIANHYFTKKIHRLHFTELNHLVASNKLSQKYTNKLVDYELRTCNFLRRDSVGNYSFVHKSFQEYLLATIAANKFFNKPVENIQYYWLLPSERKNNNKKEHFVHPEVETFFIMICEEELQKYSQKDIEEFATKTKSSQDLFIAISDQIDKNNSGLIYAKILVEQKWSVDLNFMIKQIINAGDIELSINYLIKKLDRYHDVTFISLMTGIMKHECSKENLKYIKIFEKGIENFINNDKKISSRKIENLKELYPYSRIKYKETFDKFVENKKTEIPTEKIKKSFDRIWKREKAEYDKKQKNTKR